MIRASAFDCSCSLFKHGVTQNERRNLGNLNPIYERELIKLGVDQKVEGSYEKAG